MRPSQRINAKLSIIAKGNKESMLEALNILSGKRGKKYENLAQRLETQRFAWGRGKEYMNTKHLRYSKAKQRAEREKYNTNLARKMTAVGSTPIILTTLGFSSKRKNKKIREDY